MPFFVGNEKLISKRNKLKYGVGVNDADYEVYPKRKDRCPFYAKWKDMLHRCYSSAFHKNNPTYIGCTVCPEWLTFSAFRKWMESQHWQGLELDKDILFVGNKIYSPETCVFIPSLVNLFTIDCGASRGAYLIGCNWNKRSNKFMARCNNPFSGKREYLGLYDSELDAHEAWRKRKWALAYQLAASSYVNDYRISNALRSRYLPS
jgi:hypothetical protein